MSDPLATQVLLASSHPRPDRGILTDLLGNPRLDWSCLYRLADRHKMVGVVAPLFNELLQRSLPEMPDAPWQSRWRNLAVRELAQKAALRELLFLARDRSIPLMLIKGLSVHLQAYPADTIRGASDVDLLVSPRHLPAMVHCLESTGFVLCATDSHGRATSDWPWLLRKTSEATFRRPIDSVRVDLHWSLCSPIEERTSGTSLLEALWKNVRSLPVAGTTCTIPGREEETLLICYHLLKSGPFHLRGLCDLAHLLDITPPIQWDRLTWLARETGTAVAAFHAFELLTQLRLDSVPPVVRAALRRYSTLPWLFSQSVRLDQLLETQGMDWANLGLRWRGIFFSRRPWIWIPHQVALYGKSALRRIGLC